MEGIQQMFHELMGYEEYQQDLFSWAIRKQAYERESLVERRTYNRASFRGYWRKSSSAYRDRARQMGKRPEATPARLAYKREWARQRRAQARAA